MDSDVEKILAGRLTHTAYLSGAHQSVSGSTLSGKTNVPWLILLSFEFASPPRLTTHAMLDAVIQTIVVVPVPELPLQLSGPHFFLPAPTVARHHENLFLRFERCIRNLTCSLYMPNIDVRDQYYQDCVAGP